MKFKQYLTEAPLRKNWQLAGHHFSLIYTEDGFELVLQGKGKPVKWWDPEQSNDLQKIYSELAKAGYREF